MRRMLHKAWLILKDKRGETLFEGIVSIFVFTILIVAVSLILLVSLGITGKANNWSRIMQGKANAAISGGTVIIAQDDADKVINVDASSSTIVFSIGVSGEPDYKDIEIPVAIYESVEVLAAGEEPQMGDFSFVAFEVED